MDININYHPFISIAFLLFFIHTDHIVIYQHIYTNMVDGCLKKIITQFSYFITQFSYHNLNNVDHRWCPLGLCNSNILHYYNCITYTVHIIIVVLLVYIVFFNINLPLWSNGWNLIAPNFLENFKSTSTEHNQIYA